MEDGVYHDLRALNVAAHNYPPTLVIDVYGGPAGDFIVGAVTILPKDMANGSAEMVRRWIDEETPLSLMKKGGRVVIGRMGTPGLGGFWVAQHG